MRPRSIPRALLAAPWLFGGDVLRRIGHAIYGRGFGGAL